LLDSWHELRQSGAGSLSQSTVRAQKAAQPAAPLPLPPLSAPSPSSEQAMRLTRAATVRNNGSAVRMRVGPVSPDSGQQSTWACNVVCASDGYHWRITFAMRATARAPLSGERRSEVALAARDRSSGQVLGPSSFREPEALDRSGLSCESRSRSVRGAVVPVRPMHGTTHRRSFAFTFSKVRSSVSRNRRHGARCRQRNIGSQSMAAAAFSFASADAAVLGAQTKTFGLSRMSRWRVRRTDLADALRR
jgi:hypothetical protein